MTTICKSLFTNAYYTGATPNFNNELLSFITNLLL